MLTNTQLLFSSLKNILIVLIKIIRSSASLQLDSCPRLIFSLTHKRLAFSSISPLIVDRFGSSLRFCHLELDKEAFYDGYLVHSRVLGGGGGV